MLFSLDVLRARKGDCLMLHYGNPADPNLIMIDGGPSNVYVPHLRPRLQQLRKARNLDDKKPLMADMLMVSHVDDDHIRGILDLTGELITAEQQTIRPFLQINSLWHNSFENIIGQKPDELTASVKALAQTRNVASAGAELPAEMELNTDETSSDRQTALFTLKILASIEQGAKLRSNANRLQIPLNPEFDGRLILAKGANEKVEVLDGLNFTVLGPMLPELKMLHQKHQAWLKELEKKGVTPEEALAAYVDKSVPNLSSIVTLVEAGDASMLLTGDARGDKILQGLEFSGRLAKTTGKIHVNLLKVPHHGSSNNLGPDFFSRIPADHYVFSGNGEHGNPERESLEMLLNARGVSATYTVHLTYPIDEIDKARKADWEKEQAKEKARNAKEPRPDWSVEKNSLAAMFEKNPKFKEKISVVDAQKPHLIDLADEVKF